jgi:hypothetical protein
MAKVFLALFFAFAPSQVEPWRVEAKSPPARVLPIGEPVQALY